MIDPFQESRAKAGTGILGCLRKTAEETCTPHHDKGFVRRSILDSFLKSSLEKISFNEANFAGKLIDLMVYLELCFEELPGNEGTSDSTARFFFPALLGGSSTYYSQSTALQWTSRLRSDRRTSICHVGRRLECSDELTFLTPGFFPRLQVVLLNYFRKEGWLNTDDFSVLLNVIHFSHDGMEIIVEYSSIDFFVDVLVNSTKSFQQTLRFIEDQVESRILEFCSSPQGCQGVQLVEAVVRPECVKYLFACEERRNQSVQVSDLKRKRIGNPGYIHMWSKKISGVNDGNVAAELLYGPPMLSPKPSDQSGNRGSGKFPSKVYFTIDDVEAIQKLEAKMNLAKKMAVKLHIRCDGTSVEEPHRIKHQRGRVVQLSESSEDLNLPVLKCAFHVLFEGARAGLGLFNGQIPKPIDNCIENLFRTPELDIDVKTLKELIQIKDKSERVPAIDILEMLDRYTQVCPNSEWLEHFLTKHKISDVTDCQRDFQLRKWEDPSTGQVSWLCLKHHGDLLGNISE